MSFELSAEEELIRDFVAELTQRYGRAYWIDKALRGEFPQELWDALGRGGYLGTMIPEAYGGTGLGMREMAVLMEAMGEHGIPLLLMVVSTVMASHTLTRHGNDEQKRHYLPGLANGSIKFCFAITEPNAGSNSFRIETLARRAGDHYLVSGQKYFISAADEADHILLVTRTTPYAEASDKREGISLFVVDRLSPGIELQRQNVEMLAGERQFTVFFDEVRVPKTNLVGPEGGALRVLFDALNPERIGGAATAVGLGRYVMGKAVTYAKERKVFDRPIGTHQGLAHPLAIAQTHLELAALMTRKAAIRFDQGANAGPEANMAKFAAAEAAIEACDLAIEVHGGNGFTRDFDVITVWPYVRLIRTAPVSREMILNYIGEHVLGLPRSY
jgi:acyl-CoA dehydrogenase